MAHQAHALPWKMLAEHLQYSSFYHPHKLQQSHDIIPLEKETQAKEFSYFGRKLVNQIHEFAVSERAKYEPQAIYANRATGWTCSRPAGELEPAQGTAHSSSNQLKKRGLTPQVENRPVFSDELKSRYWRHGDTEQSCEFGLSQLGDESQDIKNWLDGPHSNRIDFGDTIKILMMEASAAPPALSAVDMTGAGETRKRENMETLLLMANHPKMRIQSYRNMSWGHHFGVSRVAEEAVKAYVYLNLLVVLKENGSDAFTNVPGSTEDEGDHQKYTSARSYVRMLDSVAGSYDGDAQCIVHQDFFFSHPWSGEARKKYLEVGRRSPTKDVLADLEALREYLKGVWRILVTYDMVFREEGEDPKWEEEFENTIGFMFGTFW